jgi:hypothetical protein
MLTLPAPSATVSVALGRLMAGVVWAWAAPPIKPKNNVAGKKGKKYGRIGQQ